MVKKKPVKKNIKKTKSSKKTEQKAVKSEKKIVVVAPVLDSSGVVMVTPVPDDIKKLRKKTTDGVMSIIKNQGTTLVETTDALVDALEAKDKEIADLKKQLQSLKK